MRVDSSASVGVAEFCETFVIAYIILCNITQFKLKTDISSKWLKIIFADYVDIFTKYPKFYYFPLAYFVCCFSALVPNF